MSGGSGHCFGGGSDDRVDRDEAAFLAAVLKADDTGDFGEEGVIFAPTDIQTGFVGGAPLAYKDGSSGDAFAAEAFDTESLRV